MTRRVNIRAILADPGQRRKLLVGAAATLIAVGEDFKIDEAEARRRASALYEGDQRES
jgi:hypothetical protein